DGGRLRSPLRFRSLAEFAAHCRDHGQSLRLRCLSARSWIPHRQLHRPRRIAVSHFVRLPAGLAKAVGKENSLRCGRDSDQRMKQGLVLLWFLTFAAAGPPEPAIAYFTNVREGHVTQPDRQNFFVVDEELWNHSRPDLGDLRLYDGESSVQYAL